MPSSNFSRACLIISSMYRLKSIGESWQPWRTPLCTERGHVRPTTVSTSAVWFWYRSFKHATRYFGMSKDNESSTWVQSQHSQKLYWSPWSSTTRSCCVQYVRQRYIRHKWKQNAICPAEQDVSDKLKNKTKRQNCPGVAFYSDYM